jgi:pimeloyl-ACP methyl ester carboxylesterase
MPEAGGTMSFERAGSGEPLVLIHGTGSSRKTWAPVLPALTAERDVIAVDLPGHGESPLAPAEVQPTPFGYASVLARFLDDLGIDSAHVAGNSVGGWTALELAKLGRARSVVALAPAGLWRRHNPTSSRLSLWTMRRVSPPAILLRTPVGRTVLLGQTFGRPWRVPANVAVDIARTFRETRGFDEHLAATSRTRFTGGKAIGVPVTVAFGKRERLIPRRGRRGGELPAQTRWLELAGCGHVPMWDDPPLVARTILEGTGTAATGTGRAQSEATAADR